MHVKLNQETKDIHRNTVASGSCHFYNSVSWTKGVRGIRELDIITTDGNKLVTSFDMSNLTFGKGKVITINQDGPNDGQYEVIDILQNGSNYDIILDRGVETVAAGKFLFAKIATILTISFSSFKSEDEANRFNFNLNKALRMESFGSKFSVEITDSNFSADKTIINNLVKDYIVETGGFEASNLVLV